MDLMKQLQLSIDNVECVLENNKNNGYNTNQSTSENKSSYISQNYDSVKSSVISNSTDEIPNVNKYSKNGYNSNVQVLNDNVHEYNMKIDS